MIEAASRIVSIAGLLLRMGAPDVPGARSSFPLPWEFQNGLSENHRNHCNLHVPGYKKEGSPEIGNWKWHL